MFPVTMAAFQKLAEGPGNSQRGLGWELPPTRWPPAPLTEGQYQDSEKWHELFRDFQPTEGSDPLHSLHTMEAFLVRWMRPDLRSTKQILDQLVLEKFMTCMPLELQVLVRERKVQSCEELEALLRNKEKPRKHRVLTIQGQEYLQDNFDQKVWDTSLPMDLSLKSSSPISEVGKHPENSLKVLPEPENEPEASDTVWGQRMVALEEQEFSDGEVWETPLVIDLSRRSSSPISEAGEDPENSPEVLGEPGNQPGPGDMVWGQRQKVLLPEMIPKNSDPQGVRMEELEEDVLEDGEEAAVLTPPEAPCASSPGGLVRMEGEQNPQEGIGLEHLDAALEPPAPVTGTRASTPSRKRRGSQQPRGAPKRKRGNTPTVRAEPAAHPVCKESRRQIPYQCEDCGKRFSYQSQFTLHQRSHTGERPFQCPSCAQGFTQASDLKAHLWIHTGQKPFCCAECGKRFTHASTLRGHLRVHTQERPFQCSVCRKTFSSRGNLNVHMRTHTGQRPYPCPRCGRHFRHLGTFQRHQKTCRGAPADQGPR